MNDKKTENNQEGQSNFKVALQELLGNKAKEAEVNVPVMEVSPNREKEMVPEIILKKPVPTSYSGGTVIADDVVIDGSISSKADIRLNCVVNGNVTSEAKVFIAGTVEGDVTGTSIMLTNAHVKGNIICQNEVTLDQGTTLIGDLKCQRLDSNGKIEGSVEAGVSVILRNDSEIQGNLSAQSLTVQEGSIVNGAINIKREKKSMPPSALPSGLL